jgi:SnoaL-like domain
MTAVHLDFSAAIDRFIEAWNVSDPAERRRLLEETCASEIEISSPYGEYRGVDRQLEEISQFRKQFPNGRCTFRILSLHHSSLLQAWTTEFGGARPPLSGIDCVQFNAEGRIVRAISFSPVVAPPPTT